MPKSFKEQVAKFPAAEIVQALGCKRTTAYSWLDGSREPPKWQQKHWLKLLREARRERKRKS